MSSKWVDLLAFGKKKVHEIIDKPDVYYNFEEKMESSASVKFLLAILKFQSIKFKHFKIALCAC